MEFKFFIFQAVKVIENGQIINMVMESHGISILDQNCYMCTMLQCFVSISHTNTNNVGCRFSPVFTLFVSWKVMNLI